MRRYYGKRRRRKKLYILISIILMLVILAVVIDRQLYPVVKEYAAANAKIFANNIINSAISELLAKENITYDDIIMLSTDDDGTVKSAEVNSIAVNRLKTGAIGSIREKIGDNDETAVSIPIGSLTGSSYLSGRGPCIDVKLKMASNVSAKITSDFYSVDINQSLHIIKLEITASVFILLPYGRTTVDYSTDFLLGQTVIVGTVPEAFTNVIDSTEDLAGIINDFGAVTPE